MKNLRFKDKIAINYIVTTALLIGIVFVAFYSAVRVSISNHINADIELLTHRHLDAVEVKDGEVLFKSHDEWLQREHTTVSVSPVFVEFIDANGKLIDKSPNLKGSRLHFEPNAKSSISYNDKLVEKKIRQSQTPIFNKQNEVIGYLLVAISKEEMQDAIVTLKNIMLFAYPFILILLFYVARFIAGKTIAPINYIIDASNRISYHNLQDRIVLPENRDELHTLSETINYLLDRVEKAVKREKNFTSHASHEFRTPLSVLKGTMEVLIRKPRTHEEYTKKIKYCITKIDDLNNLLEQLLLITREENQKLLVHIQSHPVQTLIQACVQTLSTQIEKKHIAVTVSLFPTDCSINTDAYIFSTIFNNLLGNAIKFSPEYKAVEIVVMQDVGGLCCEVRDYGNGIPEEEIAHVFKKFYRSEQQTHVPGHGLGLAIAKQYTGLLKGELSLTNRVEGGIIAKLYIPLSSRIILSKS